MRARLNSLLLATACLAGVGCASKPAEEPVSASLERACENASGNSLHLTSASSSTATVRDAEIDSIITQQTSDPRLDRINRRMYLSLRSLDAELRREQRLAACGQSAQASNEPATDNQPGNAPSSGAADSGAAAGPAAVTASALAGAGTSRALRKASISPNGGGGNGATAPKIVPGSDNEIVLRRLRRAAEQETDPGLRAKLWKEYTDYRLGTGAK